jgi:hypothetical protein
MERGQHRLIYEQYGSSGGVDYGKSEAPAGSANNCKSNSHAATASEFRAADQGTSHPRRSGWPDRGCRKEPPGQRDALIVLLAYRHGLRAAEVVDLRWEQVDFKAASLHVRRVKNGTPSTHPLTGRELRELRRHQSTTDLGIKAHAHTPAQPLRRSRDNNPRGWGSSTGERAKVGYGLCDYWDVVFNLDLHVCGVAADRIRRCTGLSPPNYFALADWA